MVMNRIDIHIDVLRVIGTRQRGGSALADGLRTELQRLIGSHGLPRPWSDAAATRGAITARPVRRPLPPDATGASAGRAAARAIYGERRGEPRHDR